MRTTPYFRMRRSRSVLPIAHALRTCVTKFFRSSSLPIAEPPPVGGQTGATSDPTTNSFAAILSASCCNSARVASMLTCGSKRNRSTPSNLTPSTDALAVKSSIVSRSIAGSAPGLPLPTRPGHIALWSFGKLFLTGVALDDADDFMFQLQWAILPTFDILLSGEKSIGKTDGGKDFL